MKCAAFELPFSGTDTFGRVDVQEVLHILRENGLVHRSGDPEDEADPGQWHWTSESYPADAVSLRSITSDNFVVVDVTGGSRVIGETDFTSGPSTLHPKAIYIVEGRLYQVESLDFEGRKAYVRSVDCDYYTTAISVLEGHRARAGDPRTATCRPTATCTSPVASSASRRSSSTPTRTSGRVNSTCPSTRCTPPPTG